MHQEIIYDAIRAKVSEVISHLIVCGQSKKCDWDGKHSISKEKAKTSEIDWSFIV